MDKELMIKLGWEQDLIESILKMKKTLDESTKYSSDSVVHIQSAIKFDASSINTANLFPIAENEIRVKLATK